MIHKINKRNGSFYVSILPLAFLISLLALGSIKTEASFLNIKFPGILGDESERESEDSKDSEDSKESEKSEDEKNKASETQHASESESEDKEDEKEVETEIEDEKDSQETMEIIETTENPDGTVTKKVKITDEEGEVEYKLITYDKDGNIISKKEINEDDTDHEDKVEIIETYPANEDGSVTKKIKITCEDGYVEIKLVTYDKDGKVIKEVNLNDDGTEKTKKDKGNKEIEIEGSQPSSEMMLDLKNKLLESGFSDSINKLKLEADDGQVEIKARLVKDEKLFGIFKIEVPYDVLYNTGTDTVASKVQSIWAKILDALSF